MKKKNFEQVENVENVVTNEENLQNEQTDAQVAPEENEKELSVMTARDNDGNPIPAFPVSKGAKRDHRKTSVVYTVLAVVLHVLAYLPIVIGAAVLGVKCYNLVPYYGFWPFIGVILAGILGLVFMTVALVVARKNSKSSIRTQTVKITIAFVCLTTVFGLILTYVFPDVIAMATQGTLYCEDLYYGGEAQAEKNASLERDFIMYNVLNGNLNMYNADGTIADHGDFSYATLSKRVEDDGTFVKYVNNDIQKSYLAYMNGYTGTNNTNNDEFIATYITPIKNNERKYELFEFIYNSYVLNDFDYAFYNTVERKAFALSVLDYVWTNFDYMGMLKEGFNNARLKKLFQDNYDSFNQDGYLTFDDPLLLYAQMSGRMTVPIILRLILNEGWTYTQSGFNGVADPVYTEDGNCLYQLYDPNLVEEYKAKGGTFEYKGTLTDQDGNTITVNYGFNEDGWMMFENGVTKRPLNWLVLDMLGDPMALATLDVAGLLSGLGVPADLLNNVLTMLPTLVDSLGGLLKEDLAEVIQAASAGGNLDIGLCFDDNGMLAINLLSKNVPYGMLGYMQATWVDSNNLLFAVINVVALRNWMVIFGAIGAVLVIGAGVLRAMGEKTRERTEDSRARIQTALLSE